MRRYLASLIVLLVGCVGIFGAPGFADDGDTPSSTYRSSTGEELMYEPWEDGAFRLWWSNEDSEIRIVVTSRIGNEAFCLGFPTDGCLLGSIEGCRYSQISGSYANLEAQCVIPSDGSSLEQTAVVTMKESIFADVDSLSVRILYFDPAGRLSTIIAMTSSGQRATTFEYAEGFRFMVDGTIE